MKKNNVSGEGNCLSKSETLSNNRVDMKKLDKPHFKTLNEMTVNKLPKPTTNQINGFEVYKQLGKGKFG
jgi:hypothetical protein